MMKLIQLILTLGRTVQNQLMSNLIQITSFQIELDMFSLPKALMVILWTLGGVV